MLKDLTKPVIGVTMGLSMEDHNPQVFEGYSFEYLKQQYYRALEEQDAVILPLANTSHVEHSDYYIEFIDGLMLVGGEDVNPGLYGSERSGNTGETFIRRDYFEREMVFKAVSRKIPILGICRGHQMLNAIFGGSLYQDLSERDEPTLNHRQTEARDFSNTHEIEIVPDSRLANVLKMEKIAVNSAHHQIVNRIPEGLRPVALAPDGVVEALEGTDEGFILSVQWHPEAMSNDESSLAIFAEFIRATSRYREENRSF
jgi:putative glutamine amidotransferase